MNWGVFREVIVYFSDVLLLGVLMIRRSSNDWKGIGSFLSNPPVQFW